MAGKKITPKSKRAAIGIDVGGTKVLFALFDDSFELIHQMKVKTPKDGKKEFVQVLVDAVDELSRKAEKKNLEINAIGVGYAGSVDTKNGIVHNSPNIPAMKNFSFAEALHKPPAMVTVHNDVNAALYAELGLGAAVDRKSVV